MRSENQRGKLKKGEQGVESAATEELGSTGGGEFLKEEKALGWN